jgi:hypothetical protein|tara:strand:+ start:1171 stop:1446 length:276 start_codon:yes stop_codon:yes gene_type:complete
MKNEITVEQEAKLLLNQEIEVTSSRSIEIWGKRGIVKSIMADGRTLDIKLSNGKSVFLDVTLVSEVREGIAFAKQEQSLGPIANHLVQDGI